MRIWKKTIAFLELAEQADFPYVCCNLTKARIPDWLRSWSRT